MTTKEGDNLIALVKYSHIHNAEILAAKLQEAGIECCLTNESVLGQIEGIQVMILEKDYEQALVIYRGIKEQTIV